jgi:hypothetical protein
MLVALTHEGTGRMSKETFVDGFLTVSADRQVDEVTAAARTSKMWKRQSSNGTDILPASGL